MSKFKIALAQLLPPGTIQGNLIRGLNACEYAASQGADLILFPELWQIGYEPSLMKQENALDQNSFFLESFKAKAKELKIAIAVTYLGNGCTKPTNHLALINANGEIILDYGKVHICDFEEGIERALEPGTAFKVVELEFARGKICLGAMICFDREFPESARSLMMQGAEIIITPNACHLQKDVALKDMRLQQFRSRAFENMVGVALTNYPSPKEDGHSCAFKPDGQALMIAGEEEGIFLASFDLDELREWRAREVWGHKSRRPICYQS